MSKHIHNPHPDKPTHLHPNGVVTNLVPDWIHGENRRESPPGVHGELLIPKPNVPVSDQYIRDYVMNHLGNQRSVFNLLSWQGGLKYQSVRQDNGDIEVVFEVHPDHQVA